MKQIKVTITQTDILLGQPGKCKSCAFALALHPRFDDVNVQDDYVRLDGNSYRLSKPAQQFIKDFDRGNPVKPATFLLTLIIPFQNKNHNKT